ncbi:MAG: hypothetical protein NC328_01060 [Muribaculum sp.]|nr:hypothetical protein [Muribaculum sp.]
MGNTNTKKSDNPGKGRPILRRILKTAVWCVVGIVVLFVGFICFVTFYLTPDRLSRLIDKEASQYLLADVKVSNPRFTFWSTFPRFELLTDSITVTSRTLDSVSPQILRQLPRNAKRLASIGTLKGGINIVRFVAGGRFILHDVEINDVDVNLVDYNDSVNNYNIIPPSSAKTKFEMPFFTANSVKVKDGSLTYFNATAPMRGSALLRSIVLARQPSSDLDYTLSIPGRISLSASDLTVLRDFPFNLHGRISFDFHPFRFSFKDYAIDLGSTHGKLNLDMQMGNDINIDRLSYSLHEGNLLDFLRSIPGISSPELDRLHADLNLNLNARLTKPFDITTDSLPSVAVDFSIDKGSVEYILQSGKVFPLNHDRLSGTFLFDGQNPGNSYIDLQPFSLSTKGVTLNIAGKLTRLTSRPHCNVNLTADTDLATVLSHLKHISGIRNIDGNGKFLCSTMLDFDLTELSAAALKQGLANVNLRGNARLRDASLDIPSAEMSVKTTDAVLAFNSSTGEINANGLSATRMNMNLDIGRAKARYGGENYDISGLHISASDRQGAVSASNGFSIPVDFHITAKRMAYSSPRDSVSAAASTVKGSGHFPLNSSSGRQSILKLTAGKLDVTAPALSYSGTNALLSAYLGARRTKVAPLPLPPRTTSAVNHAILSSHRHSPEMLTVSLPPSVKSLLGNVDFKVDLRAGNALLSTRYFPLANRIGNLDLCLTSDSIVVRDLNMRSRSTGLHVDGRITNLRQFLTSPVPAYLDVDLNLALDTVNINQLARAYESGVALTKGVKKVNAPYNDALTPADTLTFLFPRNLRVNLKASADETIYRNLHLYDLQTDVRLSEGDVQVNRLQIGSDFGTLDLGLRYTTSDLNDMGLDVDATLSDVHLVNFFRNFHTLLLMMPQMKNLDGTLSLSLKGGISLFPNMYINVPGMHADMTVNGEGLTVHQNDFIRHITRMLLIRSGGDLHIRNMTVRASVHDNLLELYPFIFQFDRYKLEMEGINNFNGELYYHIGVHKSPLPFPFGINIQGMFHHPELRFGGVDYKPEKAEKIAGRIYDTFRVNFPQMLAKYLHEFIEKAAEADDSDNSEYLFTVPDYRSMRKL